MSTPERVTSIATMGPYDGVPGTASTCRPFMAAYRYLLAALANGPRPAKEIYAEALATGRFSKRTLDDAKKRLRVKSCRQTIPGPWLWVLPVTKSATLPRNERSAGPNPYVATLETAVLQSTAQAPNGTADGIDLQLCTRLAKNYGITLARMVGDVRFCRTVNEIATRTGRCRREIIDSDGAELLRDIDGRMEEYLRIEPAETASGSPGAVENCEEHLA